MQRYTCIVQAAATRRLDARALIALAHPLRLEIRDHLRRRGPATATHLAQQLGESSGSTSYHLRMLARHGFVEPDAERGKGRERWWRATPGWLQIEDDDHLGDLVAREALLTLTAETHRLAADRLARWLAERGRWSRHWRNASTDSTFVATLDAAQTRELRNELTTVIAKFTRRRPSADARSVEVQLNVFPIGDPE